MPTSAAPATRSKLRALSDSTGAALLLAAVVLGTAALALGPGLTDPEMLPATAVFNTLDGGTLTGRDFAGKIVLINFWASDCSPCVAEMPQLAATYRRYSDRGFELVAVAVEDDARADVEHYVRAAKLPFRVALDADGALAHAFGDVNDTPTTFLIDGRGNILRRYLGRPDFAELDRLIDLELNGNPA